MFKVTTKQKNVDSINLSLLNTQLNKGDFETITVAFIDEENVNKAIDLIKTSKYSFHIETKDGFKLIYIYE